MQKVFPWVSLCEACALVDGRDSHSRAQLMVPAEAGAALGSCKPLCRGAELRLQVGLWTTVGLKINAPLTNLFFLRHYVLKLTHIHFQSLKHYWQLFTRSNRRVISFHRAWLLNVKLKLCIYKIWQCKTIHNKYSLAIQQNTGQGKTAFIHSKESDLLGTLSKWFVIILHTDTNILVYTLMFSIIKESY